jgi:hypothetical protein
VRDSDDSSSDAVDRGSTRSREPVTFESWPGEPPGVDVRSGHSRRIWLPWVGLDAWRLWGIAAGEAHNSVEWTCSLDELSRELGGVGSAEVAHCLRLLAREGLVRIVEPRRWWVRVACPADKVHARQHYTSPGGRIGGAGRPGMRLLESGVLVGAGIWGR